MDSSAPEEMPPLTAAQREEIERRLAEHERDPGRAIRWEVVRKWLWSRRRRLKKSASDLTKSTPAKHVLP
jgi:putative addiction module component (TIGR02574 family)